MERVVSWEGMTQSHGFSVEVYHRTEAGVFVARLRTHSPPYMQQHFPGAPTPMIEFDDPEEIQSEDIDRLSELIKQKITSRCGKILQFFESRAL